MPDANGVVITGAGVQLPGASGVRAFGELALGEPPARPDLTRAALPDGYDDSGRAALLTRVVREAMDRAGLSGTRDDGHGVVLVCGQADLPPRGSSPFLSASLGAPSGPLGGALPEGLGQVRPVVLSHACASGGFALDHASRLLRAGLADFVVVLASRVADPWEELSLEAVRALSPDAGRPLDERRNGMTLGCGAVAVVVEGAGRAEARGTRPLVALAGSSCRVAPGRADTDRAALVACMREALGPADAAGSAQGVAEVDAVGAHATGTYAGDSAELAALAELGGERGWRDVPVFSNKGLVGHLLHASALVTVVHAVLAVRHGVVPATAGCEQALDGGGAVRVSTGVRRAGLRRVLVNSVGFGGNYSSLVLERI